MIKKLNTWIKKLKERNNPAFWIKRPIEYKTKKQVKHAKKMALAAHETTGLQYHIMPMGEGAIIIDSNWRKHYNKIKGVKKVNVVHLLHMAHFSTPTGKRLLN